MPDPFVRNGHPIYVMDVLSAEMVKYAALSKKIGLEALGVTVERGRIALYLNFDMIASPNYTFGHEQCGGFTQK